MCALLSRVVWCLLMLLMYSDWSGALQQRDSELKLSTPNWTRCEREPVCMSVCVCVCVCVCLCVCVCVCVCV